MDKSMLKNMFSSERISISDNSCYISEQKKTQICNALEKLNFSSQIITFIKEFAGVSIGIKIDKHLFQYFHVILPNTASINSSERIEIGRVDCCGQKLSVNFDNLKKCYYLGENSLIASNEDELFKYLLSEDSILSVRILPKTVQLLKNAGWYEGRTIDINNITVKFQSDGILLTESQKCFLQEFGGITGVDSNDEGFIIYDSIRKPKCVRDNIVYFTPKIPSPKDMHSYDSFNIIAYNNNIDMLRVGEAGNGLIPIWISTEGKLFRDDGEQLGRTVMEGLQTILLN
jgi:hypothetical protein